MRRELPFDPDKKPSWWQRIYAMLQERARKIAASKDKLNDLVNKAIEKAESRPGPFAQIMDDLRTLGRMVRAIAQKRYPEIPWKSLSLAVVALLYIAMPFDLIPDMFFGLGLADDAALVAFVLKQMKTDLDAFREWEKDNPAWE